MKCLLIDPHWKSGGGAFGPNVGLAYLAAVAEANGHEVQILDFVTSEGAFDKLSKFRSAEKDFLDSLASIVCEQSPKMVGITCSMGAYRRTLSIAKTVKSVAPNTLVVVGGPHVTIADQIPEWRSCLFENSEDVDCLVVGEGEKSILGLLDMADKDFRLTEVRGLVYRDAGNHVRTPPQSALSPSELDAEPFPLWSKFDLSMYPRVLYVVGSRGCQHQCLFCDEPSYWAVKYRARNTRSIVDEITTDVEYYKTYGIRFNDASITQHPHLADICRGIIERELEVVWNAFAHVNEVNAEKVRLMKDSGCRLLEVGIESGVQSTLDSMAKGTQLQQIRDAVALIKDTGIEVRGSFIVGFPGENKRDAVRTVDFARSLDLDAYSWHTFFPNAVTLRQSKRWSLRVAPIDWKSFNADVPDSCLAEAVEESPSLLLEPHTASRLAKTGIEVKSKALTSLLRHRGMDLSAMYRIVSDAVQATDRPAKEYDFFWL